MVPTTRHIKKTVTGFHFHVPTLSSYLYQKLCLYFQHIKLAGNVNHPDPGLNAPAQLEPVCRKLHEGSIFLEPGNELNTSLCETRVTLQTDWRDLKARLWQSYRPQATHLECTPVSDQNILASLSSRPRHLTNPRALGAAPDGSTPTASLF